MTDPARTRVGRIALTVALGCSTALSAALAPPPADGRRGPVVLEGRALADADGPFLPLGATLFWGLWAEAHDPERLDANLAWLAARGVDYVRILAMVGGESWADRRIDPAAAEYWPTVDRFLARLGRHGLRAQVTLFATADAMMPEPARRRAFVDRWAVRLEEERERFVLVEVANEYYNNGLTDVGELRALGQRLAERTSVLVALSAPSGGRDACAVYAGSAADLATIHYPRDIRRDGRWEAVARPWSYPAEYDAACRGRLPVAVNNEPIGPASSVADENDPVRLALAYVMTFVGQNAAYVLHAGAGVRGGGAADVALGRPPNLFDVPELDAVLTSIAAMRSKLPPDLPNWTRADMNQTGVPLGGLETGIGRGDLGQSYGAVRGDEFVLVLLDLQRSVEVTARRTVTFDLLDPVSGSQRRATVPAGAPFVFEPKTAGEPRGLVVVGRQR